MRTVWCSAAHLTLLPGTRVSGSAWLLLLLLRGLGQTQPQTGHLALELSCATSSLRGRALCSQPDGAG